MSTISFILSIIALVLVTILFVLTTMVEDPKKYSNVTKAIIAIASIILMFAFYFLLFDLDLSIPM